MSTAPTIIGPTEPAPCPPRPLSAPTKNDPTTRAFLDATPRRHASSAGHETNPTTPPPAPKNEPDTGGPRLSKRTQQTPTPRAQGPRNKTNPSVLSFEEEPGKKTNPAHPIPKIHNILQQDCPPSRVLRACYQTFAASRVTKRTRCFAIPVGKTTYNGNSRSCPQRRPGPPRCVYPPCSNPTMAPVRPPPDRLSETQASREVTLCPAANTRPHSSREC